MSRHQDIIATPENGTVTGQTNGTDRISRASKTHSEYWRSRILRRSFPDRDGKSCIAPEYSVRMRHLGRDTYFNLATPIQAAAADKARDIYVYLLANGWDDTLAKFKPSVTPKADSCTVGEFIADVLERSHLKAITVRRYAVKLRKMAADVAKLDAGLKSADKRAKYDYVNGGQKKWLARVDGVSLDVLTPETVNTWRNAYVAKAGSDPIARKSAERSAASYLRCARSLFVPDVTSALKVALPPNPFAGVKLKDPGPQRYRSEVSAEWLLTAAEGELRDSRPQLYLALVLCLWGGLRRKEADLLTWPQINFDAGLLTICRTAHFEPKTEESQRQVDLAPQALDVLRSFLPGPTEEKKAKSEFVLDGTDPNPAATYDFYRCDCTWRDLNLWLRAKGVHQRKAIHSLRKESGSLIASEFGIEAARQHLGHRDISTTSSHYVAKRKRIEVRINIGTPGKLEALN